MVVQTVGGVVAGLAGQACGGQQEAALVPGRRHADVVGEPRPRAGVVPSTLVHQRPGGGVASRPAEHTT